MFPGKVGLVDGGGGAETGGLHGVDAKTHPQVGLRVEQGLALGKGLAKGRGKAGHGVVWPLGGVAEIEAELVAHDAAEVALALGFYSLDEQVAELFQDLVAGGVAVDLVEILEVFKQLLLVHALVELQHVLQLGQTGGLPARQGEAVGVFGRAADDLHRGHRAQLGLVVIQAVGAVLRDDARQIGAQPVQHRHEVVDDDLHAVLRQIADGLAVILDVHIARG